MTNKVFQSFYLAIIGHNLHINYFSSKDENSDYQKIAIFGASALTTTIINFLPKNLADKISHIYDNDSLKHGKMLFGCKTYISPPSNIRDTDFDILLISSYFFDEEIYKQLVEIGVETKKIAILHKTVS